MAGDPHIKNKPFLNGCESKFTKLCSLPHFLYYSVFRTKFTSAQGVLNRILKYNQRSTSICFLFRFELIKVSLAGKMTRAVR